MVLTGHGVCRLMRKHGKTIRGLAMEHRITQKRVREVRSSGVRDFMAETWFWMITGRWPRG